MWNVNQALCAGMLSYNCLISPVFQGPPPIQTPAWICSGIESATWSKRRSLAPLWLQKWGRRWWALTHECCPDTATGAPVWNWDLLVKQGGHITFSSAFLQHWRWLLLRFWPGWFEIPWSQFQKCWVLSDGKIMPEYRKLSIMLSILQNQAHDKSEWTLKISGPFILLHLNFLVCQMWVIMPLHLKNDCTNTSVKCKWGELLIPFGGEVRQRTASRARGHAFQQQKKTNYWIVAYQRRAIHAE